MAFTFHEMADDKSPGNAGFSLEGGRAVLAALTDRADLEDTIQALLGSVEPDGEGGLKRKNPKAHPQYPWLFVDSISNIQGYGPEELFDTEEGLEAPAIDEWGGYQKYLLTVMFSPRPYNVLEDSTIERTYIDWTDYKDAGQSNYYATEWWRYTEWELLPDREVVEGLQGTMKLRGNAATPPDGNPFQGIPKIYIDKAIVKATWHYIPYQYVWSTNSYIRKFRYLVNQFDWCGFEAGTLLYVGANIRRFTPPFPRRVITPNNAITFSADKLCTVEFLFELTERPMADGVTPTAPASDNYIQAGHNLEPWFGDRQFYYVSTTDNASDTDNAKRYPKFFSAPFELLFTDPDV